MTSNNYGHNDRCYWNLFRQIGHKYKKGNQLTSATWVIRLLQSRVNSCGRSQLRDAWSVIAVTATDVWRSLHQRGQSLATHRQATVKQVSDRDRSPCGDQATDQSSSQSVSWPAGDAAHLQQLLNHWTHAPMKCRRKQYIADRGQQRRSEVKRCRSSAVHAGWGGGKKTCWCDMGTNRLMWSVTECKLAMMLATLWAVTIYSSSSSYIVCSRRRNNNSNSIIISLMQRPQSIREFSN